MQSESIAKLADALAKAQPDLKAPTKGKTATIPGKEGRGGYSYKYADLADVIESYRGPLAKQGLTIAQAMKMQDGHLLLITKLLHASGEWMDSEYPIASFPRPQEQGSAITYARRYAVSSLLGIAAEDDDDGAAAQEGTPKARALPARKDTVPVIGLSREEVESIHAAAKRAGIKSAAELAPVLTNICGVPKATDVPQKELGNVLEALEGMGRRRVEATA